MKISPFTSWFLDLLRLISAIWVALAHLSLTGIAPGTAWIFPIGHMMVMCFFVLSGFLIAASVEGRAMSGQRYVALRLGRLWSVLLPCLAMTLLLQLTASWLEPGSFDRPFLDRSHPLLRYPLTAFFMNEIWFTSSGMPFNSPVWSLAYEAWYYAIFGVSVFIRDPKWRYLALAALVLLLGPKILLLMPIWLLGAALWKVFRWRDRLRAWAWPMLVGALMIIGVWIWLGLFYPAMVGRPPWYFSAAWISDFGFGLAVACLILSMDLLWGSRPPPRLTASIVRKGANVTFTLYLLHYPLMMFVSLVVRFDRTSIWQVSGIMLLIFTVCYALGTWIEPQRKLWAKIIENALIKITG